MPTALSHAPTALTVAPRPAAGADDQPEPSVSGSGTGGSISCGCFQVSHVGRILGKHSVTYIV